MERKMNARRIAATKDMMKDMSNRWEACNSPIARMSGRQALDAMESGLGLNYREMALSHDVEHILLGAGSGLLHPGGGGGELRGLTVSEWFSDGECRVEKSSDATRLLCMVAEYEKGAPFVVNIILDGGTVRDCVTKSAADAPRRIRAAMMSLVKLVLSAEAGAA